MLRTAQSLPQEWAFDTGLRPRPFPDEAASLLPGLLAATRTGLHTGKRRRADNTRSTTYTVNLLSAGRTAKPQCRRQGSRSARCTKLRRRDRN